MAETTATILNPIERDQLGEIPRLHETSANRITRLLCARVYLLGIFGGLSTLQALLGAPLSGHDPGVGYDRFRLCYHALQSTLLSLIFLLLSFAMFYVGFDEFSQGFGLGPWSSAVLVTVLIKIAVINPWIARGFFRNNREISDFQIPVIGSIASGLSTRLCPEPTDDSENAYYFKGPRPFVGCGTEIGAWTIVVDTSCADSDASQAFNANKKILPIEPEDLYDAVQRSIVDLGVHGLRLGYMTFVDGEQAGAEKRAHGRLFKRPPQKLSSARIEKLDRDATAGRRYMVVQSESSSQDLVATQFLRFHKSGKLIFCEFSSYVLSPALRWLYALDRTFLVNPILYAFCGLLLFALAAFPAMGLFPLIYLGGSLLSSPFFFEDVSFFLMLLPQQYESIFFHLFSTHTYASSIVALAATYVALVVVWRVLRWIAKLLSTALGIAQQFGISFSFRERFTSRGQLQYYELQESIRFLKIHEKILINSIFKKLKAHGIDATDFKESVTAFINQGVINSGDIRGNVFTSVKSFMFRRPAKSAIRRSERRAARA